MTATSFQARLRDLGDSEDAAFAALDFKTSSGQHGQGDRLIDIRVFFLVAYPPAPYAE
jgi:hypothetical protein